MTGAVDDAEVEELTARSAPWTGLVVIASGAVAIAVLAVGPKLRLGWHQDLDHGFADSVYTISQWVIAVLLLGSGVLIAAVPRAVAFAAAASAVLAGQLAGAGAVAYRHWVPWSGITGHWLKHREVLRGLGLVMALVGAVAVLACVVQLITRGEFGRSRTKPVVRILTVTLGAVVVGLIPLALAGGQTDRLDWQSLGAFSLLYGLPWGVAIAVSAWLTRAAALGVFAAVAVSALVSTRTGGMVSIADQSIAFVFAALASGCAAVARYSDQAK